MSYLTHMALLTVTGRTHPPKQDPPTRPGRASLRGAPLPCSGDLRIQDWQSSSRPSVPCCWIHELFVMLLAVTLSRVFHSLTIAMLFPSLENSHEHRHCPGGHVLLWAANRRPCIELPLLGGKCSLWSLCHWSCFVPYTLPGSNTCKWQQTPRVEERAQKSGSV